MKKKIMSILLLSFMIVSLVMPYVPASAHNSNIIDEGADEGCLYAGILRYLYESINIENEKNIVIAKKTKNTSINKLYCGWILGDSVNVREEPDIKSSVIAKLYFNEKIVFSNYNGDWICVLFEDNNIGYVNRKYVSENEPEYQIYLAPYTNGNKTYMPYMIYKSGKYKSIFSTSSIQYKLQQYCYTGEYGIRQYRNRFCVALGSAFGLSIGQYFDLILENGEVISCIMADQKADIHTDASNIITVFSGCMSEFIVDKSYLNSTAKRMGDISYCTNAWKSRVAEVKVYDKYVEL